MNNINEIVEFILEKTKKNLYNFEGKTPVSTDENGKFRFASPGDWRLGFWGGILNYCYLLSGDKEFLDEAQKQNEILRKRLYDNPETLDHDTGFLYELTELTNYKLTGDKKSLQTAIDAADILIKRYNSKGKYIQAWDIWPFEPDFAQNNDRRIIIDCMFNLPFLFEISKITGDNKYYEVACNHAETCSKTIVRDDGTTYHTYLFDRETGKPDRGETWQGFSDDSCWSRGQAWAVGGFTMAYRYTKNENFLNTAIKTSDKFIELLEKDFIPAWDFKLRGEAVPTDASASCIAACGLLELSDYVDEKKGAFYKEAAEKLINALWEKLSSKDDENFEALIKGCTGFFRMNSEINAGIIYGDYYFVKAVSRIFGKEWIV